MRSFVLCLSLCAIVTQPGVLCAQSKRYSFYQPAAPTPPGVQRELPPARMSFSHERIYERAHREGIQRANRIESRKWMEQSAEGSPPFYSTLHYGSGTLFWGPYAGSGALWGYGWPLY